MWHVLLFFAGCWPLREANKPPKFQRPSSADPRIPDIPEDAPDSPGEKYGRYLEKVRQKSRPAVAVPTSNCDEGKNCMDRFVALSKDRTLDENFIARQRERTSPFRLTGVVPPSSKKSMSSWDPQELKRFFNKYRGLGEMPKTVWAKRASDREEYVTFFPGGTDGIGEAPRFTKTPSWAKSMSDAGNVSSEDFMDGMDGFEEWKKGYMTSLEPEFLAANTKKITKAVKWLKELAGKSAPNPKSEHDKEFQVRLSLMSTGITHVRGITTTPTLFAHMRGRTKWVIYPPEAYWEYYPHPGSHTHHWKSQVPWFKAGSGAEKEKYFFNCTWAMHFNSGLFPNEVLYVPAYHHLQITSFAQEGTVLAEAHVPGIDDWWQQFLKKTVDSFRKGVAEIPSRAPSVIIHEFLPGLLDELHTRPSWRAGWKAMQDNVMRANFTEDSQREGREFLCRLLVSQFKPAERTDDEYEGDCPDDPVIEGFDPFDLDGAGLHIKGIADTIVTSTVPQYDEPKAALVIRAAQVVDLLIDEALKIEWEAAKREGKHKVSPFLWSCMCPDQGEENTPRKLTRAEL